LLRGARHRARIRATRWLLAMTMRRFENESSRVVPAKAGTHNRRRLLRWKVSTTTSETIRHGVWVPAFAGTTRECSP
jgi:hypothetical protein